MYKFRGLLELITLFLFDVAQNAHLQNITPPGKGGDVDTRAYTTRQEFMSVFCTFGAFTVMMLACPSV
jgi:hypothetical protein